jgi:hypothetical protein
VKFITIFLLFCLTTPVLAQDPLDELEEILLTELSSTQAGTQKTFTSANIDEMGTSNVSKSSSLSEILLRLKQCQENQQIESSKQENVDSITIAFACRTVSNEIITSEVFIDKKNASSKVMSYQELTFEEQVLPPEVLLNIMVKNDYVSISTYDSVSPGMRVLMSLAKVGIPVALSFKTAKILAPNRTDWQKHFIAGAIISGATVLTTEALLRTFARNHGYHFSDTKITILSSLAGLLTSIVAGIGKEAYDRFSGRGVPEFRDAAYTAAGGAMVSFTVIIPLDRIFRSRRNNRRPRPGFEPVNLPF